LQGRGVGPTYSSSTAPGGTLDFGKVQAGHTGVLDILLSNISTDIAPGNLTALSLLGISLTGPGAAAFSLDQAFVASVLQEGDLFDLKLDFRSLKAGLFNADLVIGTDQNAAFGANGMSFTYHLQGQAVPEPASFAILGAGALMLLGARRRRVGSVAG
jgi:PEP-CTERM motif